LEGKNPELAVTVRRVFTHRPPPVYRTFFLLRHGQSKWNRAMARISLAGMLDRDHALTLEGIQQAIDLNSRWREGLLEDNCYNNMHAEAATMVPPMFDFARLDENEELELSDGLGAESSDSDSDNEHPGHSPMIPSSGSAPKGGGSANNSNKSGVGLVRLYDSFFTKRGSILGMPPGGLGVGTEDFSKKMGIVSPAQASVPEESGVVSPKGVLSPTHSSERNPLERRPSEGKPVVTITFGIASVLLSLRSGMLTH
jgi:hypothetical protein